MSFELKQLQEAVAKYTYHDADTHAAYSRLVWQRRNKSLIPRLDDAVEFLALRFKGGSAAFRSICKTWLRKNLTGLQRLQGPDRHWRMQQLTRFNEHIRSNKIRSNVEKRLTLER